MNTHPFQDRFPKDSSQIAENAKQNKAQRLMEEARRAIPAHITIDGKHKTQLAKAGRDVIEYVGQVISLMEADKRQEEYAEGSRYFFDLGTKHVIDATRVGNAARFINHGAAYLESDANLRTVAFRACACRAAGGQGFKTLNRMALVATRDIHPGEQLFYDYHPGKIFDFGAM
ncbi:hypothetical protein T484DRAFT_1854204 [Baffinella frigidus]|nr:hypothetical protein T484DRAFT_1854204 [Cryptophyta sp. CCMP2293]